MASIDRNDVAALIQEGYSTDFLNAATETSAALAAFPTISMGSKVTNLPVVASDAEADFVGEWSDAEGADNSNASKPTSKVTWGRKTLHAEEIAVIIPVHENVLADASVDVLGEITRQGGQAIARRLDGAVFNGTRKPATWTSADLVAAATAAGQVVTEDSVDDLVDALYTIDGSLSDAGFNDPIIIGRRSLNARLRNERDKNGAFLGAGDVLADYSPIFARQLAADTTAFVVDRDSVRIGVRSDVQVKFLDQATVGGINLAETDQVALRFTARYAYVLKDNAAVWQIKTGAAPTE